MPRITLHIGPAVYRAIATTEEAAALDVAALEQEATLLATLPPAQRDAAAAALLATALGIARLNGKTALSASQEPTK